MDKTRLTNAKLKFWDEATFSFASDPQANHTAMKIVQPNSNSSKNLRSSLLSVEP